MFNRKGTCSRNSVELAENLGHIGEYNRRHVKALLPKRLPTAKSKAPRRASVIDVASSGSEVVMATRKVTMKQVLIFVSRGYPLQTTLEQERR